METLMLNETEVQRLLDPDMLLDALAEGFKALSEGHVDAPKRIGVTVPDTGLLLSMPAYQQGREITVKLVSVFHDNHRFGIPSHQAIICLFDAQTGSPLSFMEGSYITALRTAGAAALSTQQLARTDSHVLAIIGAGVQGRSHLKMLPRVRQFSEIRIASAHYEHAEQLASADSRARAVESIEQAVRGADVVCLCTHSGEPVISYEWLSPGMHITSIGYSPPGGEVDPKVIEHGHLFVETRMAFEPPPAGCGELAGFDRSTGTELGEVLLGQAPGRRSQDEITVYKAMGHACEDMAAASLVYRRAKQEGIGRAMEI
jgi:ornithine cyclodeaminase/alanine dehydrogenase-like protein (mu-crystallin family)